MNAVTVAERPMPDLTAGGPPAGLPVLVRGMGPGLAGVLAPLTEGRGGRFSRDRRGEVVYLPSGGEPVLYLGSARGVPCHAAIAYRASGASAPEPRFAAPEALPRGPAHFRREVWPLVAKDLGYAYYHELITAHPGRVRTTWEDFAPAYAAEEWGSRAVRALIRHAVPRFADRLDLDRLDRPLAGIRFGDRAGLQRWMRGYLRADLARRADPSFSADLALARALRRARDGLAGTRHADPWLDGLTRFLAEGPPAAELVELGALAAAGIVVFLGGDLQVRPHGREEVWRVSGSAWPGAVEVHAVLDTRDIVDKQEEYR
ncbi:hypothetical protein ABZU32_18800 [Sphaerisporangium sp. NPDC005288]|uniref:hypothetical protein n=1 Tax=Sphaerisporangium sp. NPDC005288 TaxID=3155114 RepID=UPI0033BC55C7